MQKIALVAKLLALLLVGCAPQTNRHASRDHPVLRLAVTTSTSDSGLVEVLVPVFEKAHRVRVDVLAAGTGAALRLGQAGDVDVVLVHAQTAEDLFMAAGHGIRREGVMHNSFQILGPEDDPGHIRQMDPAQALQKIAGTEQPFVSRGDDSGTYQRELKLWNDGGGHPRWDGYVETGRSMGATLIIADQINAYILSDRATYLRFKKKLRLVPLITSSPDLHNPYGIIVVNPKNHSLVNGDLAQAFVDFMISSPTQQLICDYRIDGESLFYPEKFPNHSEQP